MLLLAWKQTISKEINKKPLNQCVEENNKFLKEIHQR
jgi:hypothetical protein